MMNFLHLILKYYPCFAYGYYATKLSILLWRKWKKVARCQSCCHLASAGCVAAAWARRAALAVRAPGVTMTATMRHALVPRLSTDSLPPRTPMGRGGDAQREHWKDRNVSSWIQVMDPWTVRILWNRPAECSGLRVSVWYESRGAEDLFWGWWRPVSTTGELVVSYLAASSNGQSVNGSMT